MIDQNTVRNVARLARLSLSDEQVERFSSQLNKVFGYIENLNELNTDGVEPTLQVTGLSNVLGEDKVAKPGELPTSATGEELLKCSELEVDSKQIRVMKTIK